MPWREPWKRSRAQPVCSGEAELLAESAGHAPGEAAALVLGLHVWPQGVVQVEEGDQDVNMVGAAGPPVSHRYTVEGAGPPVSHRYTLEGAGPPVSHVSLTTTLLLAWEAGGRGGCCPGFWRRDYVSGPEIALVASSSSPP